MNKGRILKVHHGHHANCSAISYMGHVIVSYGAYLAYLLLLLVAQLTLLAKRLAAKPWICRLRVGLWVIPHVVAMPMLWIWASGEGVTKYASVLCVGVLELVLLVSLGVGWVSSDPMPWLLDLFARPVDLCARYSYLGDRSFLSGVLTHLPSVPPIVQPAHLTDPFLCLRLG